MAFCLRYVFTKIVDIRLYYTIPKFTRQQWLLPRFNNIATKNKCLKTRTRPPGVLLAGILTWLGLKEKEEEEDVLIMTIKRAILSLQRDQYDKAEAILHSALTLAQERQDMEGQRYIFDLLANAAYNKGDFLKAEKLFLQVTKELVASGTSVDDNAIVEISLKLATIYSRANDDAKAEEGYRYCIETQQKKLNSINLHNVESLSESDINTALLWGMSIDWYARHLLAKGFFKAAQGNFQKALEISEKINGPSHPQTLVLINDIGSVISLQKEYDQAIEWFEKAIARIDESNDNPELPTFYCNLGATYFQKGDLDKAQIACSTALKLAKTFNNSMAELDAKECLEEVESVKNST